MPCEWGTPAKDPQPEIKSREAWIALGQRDREFIPLSILSMSHVPPVFDKGSTTSEAAQRVDSIAWATFFIWVGVTALMEAPWGWFLAGVGAITLAAQLAHSRLGDQIDRFWMACGLVFLVWGAWTLLRIQWPLPPILIILLGIVLLGRTLIGSKR